MANNNNNNNNNNHNHNQNRRFVEYRPMSLARAVNDTRARVREVQRETIVLRREKEDICDMYNDMQRRYDEIEWQLEDEKRKNNEERTMLLARVDRAFKDLREESEWQLEDEKRKNNEEKTMLVARVDGALNDLRLERERYQRLIADIGIHEDARRDDTRN